MCKNKKKIKKFFIGAVLMVSIFAFQGLAFAGVTPSIISFGEIPVAVGPKTPNDENTRTLTIENSETYDILYVISYDQPGMGTFFPINPPTTRIGAGGSAVVTINFFPDEAKIYNASLTVGYLKVIEPPPPPPLPSLMPIPGLPPEPVTLTGTGISGANQPPVLNSAGASPNELWPANNKEKEVLISVDATDPDGDVITVKYAVEDEYGEYNTEGELPGGSGAISLMAARDGDDKDGRVYTIWVWVEDPDGAQSAKEPVTVTVPHDQGKGKK